ncbi:NmrA-like family domain-containing protein [Colletotrichum siamense]|uniref:NmrA-like family domain-containing protein n=1 Tax=Colletotrichum siamense TaxID=690259 RepID=A0A9P5END7_COLSI|nr:NmrA-like family domain-containing protein [Colletotrichum siamense]KAF4855389.1 NmrA-like family domain-containing protein [Colletotrichum siamense]
MAVSSARRKAILVIGATGKQGGATVEALIEANATSSHQVLALTRNRESSSAKRLEVAGVKIVQGDLNDVPAVFREAKKAIGGFEPHIWGVFSVQTFMGKGASIELEELQGKGLVDGALANGVQHFVEANEIFRRKAGRDLPGIPNLLGRLLLKVAGDFGKMCNWFSEEGYGADVAALKMEHPGLLTWSNWLDDEGRRLVVQQP